MPDHAAIELDEVPDRHATRRADTQDAPTSRASTAEANSSPRELIDRAAHATLHAPSETHTAATRVQARLTVGASDDPAEREADDVAAVVLQRIQRTRRSSGERSGPDSPISEHGEAASPRIRRAGGSAGFAVDDGFERSIASSRGRPLSDDVRRRMEPAFGTDLSHVRLHTGAKAQQLSAEIQAEAFTANNDVFIGRSDFDPSSSAGTELLAHEVTHVLQQGGTAAPARRRAIIRRRLSAEADKALTTATKSNPAYAAKKAAVDKYPGTDIDNVTLEEQSELTNVDSTWKTRLRTKKVRTGAEDEEAQLDALADLIRARNLAEFSTRTIDLRAAPVGPNEKYTSEGAKARRRAFYLSKANEQKKKDRNLLRLGVAAPETREYLKLHGFHQSARDVVSTVNPIGPNKDSTTAPKAQTRPSAENALGVSTRQDVAEWARGPRIEVRSTFIGGPILGIRVRAHLFIVYTSKQGQQFYFRGGPDGDDFTVADYGPYTSDTIDYDPSAPSVTVMQGPEAEGKLDALVAATQRINSMKVPYVGSIAPGKLKKAKGMVGEVVGTALATDGENCNRTAWTILNRAGVPIKKPSGKHPGWGKQLGSNVKGEREMEAEDSDRLDPPIDHVVTAQEAGGNGLLQTYIDRAAFVKGARLPVGTKVQIVAEGRGYRTYRLGTTMHFVKKSADDDKHDVVAMVRSRIAALKLSTDQLQFFYDDDDDGWDSVKDLTDDLGLDDPNEVHRAILVELTARKPGGELVYLNDRLDEMSDAQLKEMAMNLPRLGHFAKQVRVSASQVLKAVQGRVADITRREQITMAILALAPDANALNIAANDYPDFTIVKKIAADCGLSPDEALDAIDDLRPAANQGNFLHDDIVDQIKAPMLDDLQSGKLVFSPWATQLGVSVIWLTLRLIEYCETLPVEKFDPSTHEVALFMDGRSEPVYKLKLAESAILLKGAMKGHDLVSVDYKGGFFNVTAADFDLIERYAKGEFTAPQQAPVDPAKIEPATYGVAFHVDWGGKPKEVVQLDKVPKTIDIAGAMKTKECVNIEFKGEFLNVSLVDFEILQKWAAGAYG